MKNKDDVFLFKYDDNL